VGLAHCAWFSEISASTAARARITLVSELMAVAIAVPVWLSYRYWRTTDLFAFRVFAVALAAAMGALFVFAHNVLATRRGGSAIIDEDDMFADGKDEDAHREEAARLVATAASGAAAAEELMPTQASAASSSLSALSAASASNRLAADAATGTAASAPALIPFLKQLLSNRNFWYCSDI
jgi:hypothetical protein